MGVFSKSSIFGMSENIQWTLFTHTLAAIDDMIECLFWITLLNKIKGTVITLLKLRCWYFLVGTTVGIRNISMLKNKTNGDGISKWGIITLSFVCQAIVLAALSKDILVAPPEWVNLRVAVGLPRTHITNYDSRWNRIASDCSAIMTNWFKPMWSAENQPHGHKVNVTCFMIEYLE